MTPLQPLEVYILDCFRDPRSAALTISDIIGESTANRHEALIDALIVLESQHGMLRRCARKDTFELTDRGRQILVSL